MSEILTEAIRRVVGEQPVIVVGVSRAPGVHAVVTLRSDDHDVDPVGAVIGLRGAGVRDVLAVLPPGERLTLLTWEGSMERSLDRAMLQVFWDDAHDRQRLAAAGWDGDVYEVEPVPDAVFDAEFDVLLRLIGEVFGVEIRRVAAGA